MSDTNADLVARLRRATEPYFQRDYEYGDLLRLLDEAADALEARAAIASAESAPAADYHLSTGEQRTLNAALRKSVKFVDAPAAAPESAQAVAHCALTPAGKVAYFDGKPMFMVGPVGNEHHPTPLYTHRAPARVAVALTQEQREAVAMRIVGSDLVSIVTAERIVIDAERAVWDANHLTAPEGSR